LTGWQFWIDRGGTFTDVVAMSPHGELSTAKVLSENPERYPDAATAGIRTALGLALDAPLPAGEIRQVKMGTTVATNALLERKGARTLLLVNEGFGDLLRIGHQTRPRLFDLDIRLPVPLYEAVEEVGGRVGVSGEVLSVLDEVAVRAMLASRKAAGFEACAIALIHAWKYPAVELRLAELAHEAGFSQISASHQVSPLVGLVSRGRTTVVDAYLSPVLRRYVDQVASELGETPLYFMQSNGGLAAAADFQGKDAILSGPAGGVVGAARTAEAAGEDKIIAFDMGGTSTDVALYAGQFERAFDTEVAGAEMRVPMMAIETVAAGGGSILHFDGSRFRVGPDSAGANPGPAAYRRGGPLTVTDANVMCGKIVPAHFPAIFGPDGDQPLDAEAVAEKFGALASRDRPRPARRSRGLPVDRGRQHGRRHQARGPGSWSGRRRLHPAVLWRRRGPARLSRRRRTIHGAGADPSPRRRAVGLRHGLGRPDRHAPSRCRGDAGARRRRGPGRPCQSHAAGRHRRPGGWAGGRDDRRGPSALRGDRHGVGRVVCRDLRCARPSRPPTSAASASLRPSAP
jgi:5-oxoprolinase (ATP-hydrolysing)